MHLIKHTEAIVLGFTPKRESDALVDLYTKELGMIRAEARGVRNLRSKSRFALQTYSVVALDLIPLKKGWRIGSVRGILAPSPLSALQYSALYKISKLITRLCPGQESHSDFFLSLRDTYTSLLSPIKDEKIVASMELVAVLRILFHLGYITGDIPSDFVSSPITDTLLADAYVLRTKLIKTVNQTLKETML